MTVLPYEDLTVLTARSGVQGAPATIHVVGEVDIATAGTLAEALAELLRSTSGAIIVDCARWTFVDTSGLDVLRWFADAAERRDRTVFLANLSDWMGELIHHSGVDTHFRSGMAGFRR